MRDSAEAIAYAKRREQARKHVLAVIWRSIQARAADLAGRPADARDASLDAAAHARVMIATLSGITQPSGKGADQL